MDNFEKFPDITNYAISDDDYENYASNIAIFRWDKETVVDKETSTTLLLFIVEGSVELSYDCVLKQTIKKKFFFLIPQKEKYTIRFQENGRIVIFRLDENMLLKNVSKGINGICKGEKFCIRQSNIFTVQTNHKINHMLKECISTANISLHNKEYSACKTEELLILLKSYYSGEILARLFQPVFTNKIVFKSLILQNRNKLFTVDEYASFTHLNRNTFRLRFKETFGMTPTDWIQQERAASIFRELTETEKPIYNIMLEYGFNNFPNFSRFCKTHLKSSPGLIRRGENSS